MSNVYKADEFIDDAPQAQVFPASEFADATNDAPTGGNNSLLDAAAGVAKYGPMGAFPEARQFASDASNAFFNRPTGPDANRAATFLGRNALPIAASILAPESILALGFATAAGRFGQAAIQQGARRFDPSIPEQGVGSMAKDAAIEGAANAAGAGILKYGAGAIGERIPAIYRQVFGVAEPTTKYVLERGPSKVLSPGNMNPDAPLNALEAARDALTAGRKNAGMAVGATEDALRASGALSQPLDVTDVSRELAQMMERRGFTGELSKLRGPVGHGGSVGGDVGMLEQIKAIMDSGNLTAEEALKLKRILDDKVTYTPGAMKPIGGDAERIVKDVAGALRDKLTQAFPDLAQANANFSEAAKAYEQFRRPLGGQSGEAGNIFSDDSALRRLRLAFEKGGPAREALAQFDKTAVPGQGLMQNVFDTLAAQEFMGQAPKQLSPSSPIFRSLAAAGISAPRLGGALLKGGELAAPAAKEGVRYIVPATVAGVRRP